MKYFLFLGAVLTLGCIIQVSTYQGLTIVSSDSLSYRNSMHGTGEQKLLDFGPSDDYYDLRAIDTATLHHESVIAMAKDAIQKSKNPHVLKIANEMIDKHSKQQKILSQWRSRWYPDVLNVPISWHPHLEKQWAMPIEQIQGIQMMEVLNDQEVNYDKKFLNAMIKHHQTSLAIAQEIKDKSPRSLIRRVGLDMFDYSQDKLREMTVVQ